MANETQCPIDRMRKRQELAVQYLCGEITLDEYHEMREPYSTPYAAGVEATYEAAAKRAGITPKERVDA